MDKKTNSQIAMSYAVLALILFILSSLLGGCSTKHVAHRDGPPNFYVDETKVPNAVPKCERLSKYGNMSSYVVFGKRYYTMRSSKNYNEVGIASWYGTQFHSHSTSNGERYNMLGMTAAHKSLPLPTYVEVTNLKNHHKIIVKVNDRGPFESNRIIDLSYIAAKKLGMLGHGTAMVRVKAIDPFAFGRNDFYMASKKNKTHHVYASNDPLMTSLPRRNETESMTPSSTRFVYLQVGAFRNKLHAERLRQRLIGLLGSPVQISNPSLSGKLYRVKIGPIHDVATANKITHRLKGMGIKSNKSDGA